MTKSFHPRSGRSTYSTPPGNGSTNSSNDIRASTKTTEAVDVTTSTIAYHLDRLGKTGHIITITPPKSNEKLCFTPDNVYLWSAKSFRVLLGRATPRKVALYLTKNPGATTKQIAQALELSVPTIQRHVRKLQEEKLIQATRVDRHVYYHAEQRLVEWLERMGRE